MQDVLPSGIRVIYRSFEIESIPAGQDARHAKPGQSCSVLHFNAIDQDGVPGSCPDWLEFEIIEPPFKQEVKHDTKRANSGCCACHTHPSQTANGR